MAMEEGAVDGRREKEQSRGPRPEGVRASSAMRSGVARQRPKLRDEDDGAGSCGHAETPDQNLTAEKCRQRGPIEWLGLGPEFV